MVISFSLWLGTVAECSHRTRCALLIGQAACIGDGRSYNTALIVLDSDFAPVWAQQNGLGERSLEGLLAIARDALDVFDQTASKTA